SAGGGSRPAWSKNGSELFYLAVPSTAMMAVPVQTTPTFSAGNATKLFDGPWSVVQAGRTYDVSRDGKRFLNIKDNTLLDARSPSQTTSPTITVVLNWAEELNARLPAVR